MVRSLYVPAYAARNGTGAIVIMQRRQGFHAPGGGWPSAAAVPM
jgi:hypothetical protein